MGPTLPDIARSLSETIPHNGTCFTGEQTYFQILQETAARRNTRLHLATGDAIADSVMKGFTYLEHKDNVALALAVCIQMGVQETDALRGMQRAIPDPGVLRVFTISQSGRRIEFVNAFAANDPDSYAVIWRLLKPFMTPGKKVVLIVNCRKDRIQRTESLADLIAGEIPADHFILVGEHTTVLEHRAIALGLPASRLTNLPDATPESVFEAVLSETTEQSLVV